MLLGYPPVTRLPACPLPRVDARRSSADQLSIRLHLACASSTGPFASQGSLALGPGAPSRAACPFADACLGCLRDLAADAREPQAQFCACLLEGGGPGTCQPSTLTPRAQHSQATAPGPPHQILSPLLCRACSCLAWEELLRWSAMFFFAAAPAYAASLVGVPLAGTANLDGEVPLVSIQTNENRCEADGCDVVAAMFRFIPSSRCCRNRGIHRWWEIWRPTVLLKLPVSTHCDANASLVLISIFWMRCIVRHPAQRKRTPRAGFGACVSKIKTATDHDLGIVGRLSHILTSIHYTDAAVSAPARQNPQRVPGPAYPQLQRALCCLVANRGCKATSTAQRARHKAAGWHKVVPTGLVHHRLAGSRACGRHHHTMYRR